MNRVDENFEKELRRFGELCNLTLDEVANIRDTCYDVSRRMGPQPLDVLRALEQLRNATMLERELGELVGQPLITREEFDRQVRES